MTNSDALYRTLSALSKAYTETKKRELDIGYPALIDTFTLALSNRERLDKKTLRKLKWTLKLKFKPFYKIAKPLFSIYTPTFPYDYQNALKHIDGIIYGSDKLCEKLVLGEYDKASSIADALHNYPNYLFGQFDKLSDEQFFELIFGYYPKLYGEPFFEEMHCLFK